MGLYTEEQQQKYLVGLRRCARETLEQVQRVTKLARFGADEASLRALDQCADDYRANGIKGVVNDNNTRFYIVGLGTLMGDLLLKKYGGKWVIDKEYTIETLNAAGKMVHLTPYVPVAARVNGNTEVSIHRYFFERVPRILGFVKGAPGATPAPAPSNPMLALIKKNTAALVNMFSAPNQPATFGLNAQSIGVLEDYIGRNVNSSTTDSTKEQLMNLIGSFLGECIVAKYGAQWSFEKEGGARLVLRAGGSVHFLDPFGKVAKRIQNGPEDNIAFYFAEFIPHVIKASR
jgi:hypothetical protein